MKVAFIARSTLYSAPGGDTVQVQETARHLALQGVSVDILLTHERINYENYSLLHFFNVTRPADIIFHINRTSRPFLLSPIFIDYSEFDRQHRAGLSGMALRNFSKHRNEYLKTVMRWIKGKDGLRTKSYLWKGQENCMREVIERAALILPNSKSEYERLKAELSIEAEYMVVPNGIDDSLFQQNGEEDREKNLVICAARIEGIKNQLNLIRALNGTSFTLLLIGSPSPNQQSYYKRCVAEAEENVRFIGRLPQKTLVKYYRRARVHALPSWFETCGLSSLEAAAMGCNIIVTDRGYTREYFGSDAFYCNPGDPASIRRSIEEAAELESSNSLKQKIFQQYTWKESAALTLQAYHKITSS